MFGLQIHAKMKKFSMFYFWQNCRSPRLDFPWLFWQVILKKFEYITL